MGFKFYWYCPIGFMSLGIVMQYNYWKLQLNYNRCKKDIKIVNYGIFSIMYSVFPLIKS